MAFSQGMCAGFNTYPMSDTMNMGNHVSGWKALQDLYNINNNDMPLLTPSADTSLGLWIDLHQTETEQSSSIDQLTKIDINVVSGRDVFDMSASSAKQLFPGFKYNIAFVPT